MTRQESAALNMAKFIRAQTLLLLERLEQMDLDEAAGCCEHLHDQAEALYAMLNAQIGEENAGKSVNGCAIQCAAVRRWRGVGAQP